MKTIYTTLFLLVSHLVFSQDGPVCFPRSGYDFPQDLVKDNDGNYLIAGCGYSYNGQDANVLARKIKPNGETLWERTFPKTEPVDLRIKPFNDGYLLIGKERFIEITPTEKPFVMYLSNTGDPVWSIEYPKEDYYFSGIATQIHIEEGGDAFFIGVNNFLKKIDKNGNELMSLSMSSIGLSTLATIQYFFVDDESNWRLFVESLGSQYLVKLSPDFSPLWQKYISSHFHLFFAEHISHDYKNRTLFVGKEQDYPFLNTYWKGLSFDSQGELLWSKRFDAPFTRNSHLRRILDFQDGYVLFGNSFRIEPPEYNNRYYPLILKIDDAGEEEWFFELPYYGPPYSGVQILEEGAYNFSFTGHYQCEESSDYDIYFDQIEIPPDVIGVIGKAMENDREKPAFVISPNPTPGEFNVNLDKLRQEVSVSVFTPGGQLLQRQYFDEAQTFTLMLDGPPGMYFVKMEYGNEPPIIRKLMKL